MRAEVDDVAVEFLGFVEFDQHLITLDISVFTRTLQVSRHLFALGYGCEDDLLDRLVLVEDGQTSAGASSDDLAVVQNFL